MRTLRRLALLVAIVAVAAGVACYENWLRVPPNWAPWQPVALDAKPGWLANLQLNSLASDGAACRATLTRAHLRFARLADRDIGAGCGFTDVVRADAASTAISPAPVATCGMAAALAWYQLRLDEIAMRQFGTRVAKIEQLGTYACRNINSAVAGRRSQHATANAIDIAAFHLADGRVISVLADYGQDTPEGRFLDSAHGAACGLFNIVLGPKYNRLHASHFHLDMGGFRFCR